MFLVSRITACAFNPCRNQGICVLAANSGGGGIICKCPVEYEGSFCENKGTFVV